jgi:hypothetical protein
MYNTGKEGTGELYPWLKQVPDPELLNMFRNPDSSAWIRICAIFKEAQQS